MQPKLIQCPYDSKKSRKTRKRENFSSAFVLQVNPEEKFFLWDFFHVCLNHLNFQITVQCNVYCITKEYLGHFCGHSKGDEKLVTDEKDCFIRLLAIAERVLQNKVCPSIHLPCQIFSWNGIISSFKILAWCQKPI